MAKNCEGWSVCGSEAKKKKKKRNRHQNPNQLIKLQINHLVSLQKLQFCPKVPSHWKILKISPERKFHDLKVKWTVIKKSVPKKCHSNITKKTYQLTPFGVTVYFYPLMATWPTYPSLVINMGARKNWTHERDTQAECERLPERPIKIFSRPVYLSRGPQWVSRQPSNGLKIAGNRRSTIKKGFFFFLPSTVKNAD